MHRKLLLTFVVSLFIILSAQNADAESLAVLEQSANPDFSFRLDYAPPLPSDVIQPHISQSCTEEVDIDGFEALKMIMEKIIL